VTYGFGMLVGSFLSGYALDYFSTPAGASVARNWSSFWLSSAAMSAAIGLLVLLFFRSRAMIRAREVQAA
jgi:hypothetical protein